MPDRTAVRSALAADDQDTALARPRITLAVLAAVAGVAAVLHVGREVFLPLAIAVLVTFALSPMVTALRNRGLPPVSTVLVVVTLAFAVIGLFLLVVVTQLSQLMQELPAFQHNIMAKLDALQESGRGSGIFRRLANMVSAINTEIGAAMPAVPEDAGSTTVATRPLPVEVVEPRTAVELLRDLVVPLVSPIATAGLVIVVVIFMLLEREDLRDRFIRLLGSNDLHRTTRMLEEAGSRVANYLLIQLLVNVIYAAPIGLGLWLIGVPNALLWGLLTLVLRFVPYIGSVLAAAFPLFLAFAVSPDWSAVLWTAALFAVVELLTSNVIEPWLYGARTGVSPLAIIVAAIFWTWIWGPLGLVLSTPLTVCLVVLGRHVPQFALFDILFGDEPVLAPHSRLYQRLLVGDAVESTLRAEEALEEAWLAEYYRDVGLPALLLAHADYERGVLTREREDRLAESALRLVRDLEPVVAEELAELRTGARADETVAAEEAETPLSNAGPDGLGRRIACIGGRSRLDDVAAAMLAQTMAAEGAQVAEFSHADLMPARFATLVAAPVDCVVLNFLDSEPSRASLLHIRRIKRAAPQLRVGVVIWEMPENLAAVDGVQTVTQVSPERLRDAEEIGADFAVSGMDAALQAAFAEAAPLPLPEPARRSRRRIGRG